jgi:ribosomal protein S18 acetylase RimI-like enzyme
VGAGDDGHAGAVCSDVCAAERALHRRAGLACAAARAAGVPGSLRVWEEAGLLAVLASDPGLGFLSSVSGVAGDQVSAAITLVNAPVWDGVAPTVVISQPDPAARLLLAEAGLVPGPDRPLAVIRLDARRWPADAAVVDAGADEAFTEVLVAGYEADGVVAAFLRAEHQLPQMRRFVLLERGVPVAAAAMTVHDEVAVLGGASTLPEYRRRGAQSRLLRHRLRVAAEAGCALAVATARSGSVSVANLRRAGFVIHQRSAWRPA